MDAEAMKPHLTSLPDHVISRVMNFLPREDRVNFSTTCTRTRDLLWTPAFWREFQITVDYTNKRTMNALLNVLWNVGKFILHLNLYLKIHSPVHRATIYGKHINTILKALPSLSSLNIDIRHYFHYRYSHSPVLVMFGQCEHLKVVLI